MLKRNKDDGFTLVELIVVIVILSILIGVTIGGISSWIKKARLNTDLNNANTIQTMVSTKLGTSSWNLAFNKAARQYDIVWFWTNKREKEDKNKKDDNPLNYSEGFAQAYRRSVNGSDFNSTFRGSSMDRQISEILDVDGTLLESKSGNYYMLRVWCNDGLTTHVECHLVSPETRAKLNPLVNKELPKDYDFSQCFGITVFDYITADGE